MKVVYNQSVCQGSNTLKCVSFAYDEWRLLFDKVQIRYWMAQVLNNCQKPYGLHIRGYLLGEQITYLILEGDRASYRKFYKTLNKHSLVMLRSYFKIDDVQAKAADKYFSKRRISNMSMFQIKQLRNSDYCNALLNEPLIYQFHNHGFISFYEYAIQSRFCSRIDYEDGQGPVTIEKTQCNHPIQVETV